MQSFFLLFSLLVIGFMYDFLLIVITDYLNTVVIYLINSEKNKFLQVALAKLPNYLFNQNNKIILNKVFSEATF